MNPERWQAVGELFDKALALPDGERTACIDRHAGDDDELRREVRSLLASHDAAPGGFVQERIKKAVVSFHDAELAVSEPARAGPYRLVRVLGRGGMGTVFLAERDDGHYKADVAVKLVRPGMDTQFVLARFCRERQTLARLQHPNIARLLDGGTTQTGLPYIVMEHIDGVRITKYAGEKKLGIAARVRLFLDVCSAVDYAHRNFIVHRDLKPGNILVDSHGAPKLLDFGVCRLLTADPLASPSDSAITQGPMTPSYASPEQIRGEAVTPLSDIYSLGVVLYELLTENRPYRFSNGSAKEMARAMAENEIPLASTSTGDSMIALQLAGDLDHILKRALETKPERRYESAEHLADDLRRYLSHEPVHAHPQTLRYRTRKFLRRYPREVAAVGAVFLALIGGLGVSRREARIADTQLSKLQGLASGLVFNVAVERDSLRALRDVAGVSPGDLSLQIYCASVNLQLGDALRMNGDFAGAEKAYSESASIADLGGRSGQTSFAALFVLSNLKLAQNAVMLGSRAGALDFARRAFEFSMNVPGGSVSSFLAPRALGAMGLTYAALANSPLRQSGDREQALSWLSKSLDAWHQAQGQPDFAAAHSREMQEVESALKKLENR